MIVYLIAVLVTITLGVVFRLEPGGLPLIAIGFFMVGIATAWNRYRRHSARGIAVSAPILPSGAELKSQTGFAEHASDLNDGESLWDPSRIIGRIVDGRLMLTMEELTSAVQQPRNYANLLMFNNRAELGEAVGKVWFLALGLKSGVFFDADRTQVWTVTPDTVEIPDNGRQRMIAT